MTSKSRKRKWAGAPISEQRKHAPEPTKLPSKPKPREYVLRTRQHVSYVIEHEARYPSRAARDQARADALKKAGSRNHIFKWYKDYKVDVTFEESER